MSFTGLTDAGYDAPRAADFLTLIRDAVIDELDARGLSTDIDFDRDTVWGITTAVVAVQLGELGDASQAVYDAFDPNNASGIQLDSLGAIVGVPRLQAEKAQVELTLGNTTASAALLPAGRVAEGGGDDGKARWVLLADTTIPATGTISADFEAEQAGDVAASIGDISTIVTPVDGWTSVTNPAVPTPGRDLESDADYRLRRAQSLQVTGGRSVNALRSDLLALDGILGAAVADNDLTTSVVVEGITLAPHSTAIIIHPNTITTAQQQAVAEAIYDQVSAGIYTNGSDVVATVTGADGFSKTVRFDFAAAVVVPVGVTATPATGYTVADVTAGIEDAITAYFETLSVGDDVLLLRVLEAIAGVDGVLGATVLLDGVAADRAILLSEIASLGSITVV